MGYVLLFITITMVLFFSVLEYRNSFLSPAFIFQVYQLIMLIGLWIKIDFSHQADYVLCWCYLVGNLSFALGNFLASRTNWRQGKIQFDAENSDLTGWKKQRLLILAVIGIVICAVFFAQHGNVFIQSLRYALAGDQSNLSNMRRGITLASGSGYIYELRVYVIPFIVFYFLLYSKGKYRRYGIVLLLPTLLFLVASGQRGGLVNAILMILISLLTVNHYLSRQKVLKNRNVRLVLLFGAIAFALLTIYNGRTRNNSLFYALFKRIFLDNQGCDLVSFRYIIYGQGRSYGYDWLQMLLRFVPGVGDPNFASLSGKTFKLLFGGFGGTSPPSLWGSMYYNWGFPGIMLFSFLFGVLYRMLYVRLFKRKLTPYRLHMFAYLFYAAGSWICESPVHFINGGFLVLLMVHYYLKLVVRGAEHAGIDPVGIR